MRNLVFLSFIVATVSQLNAQLLISGQIIATDSNEPLPFATIAFKDQTRGTISNRNGDFQLQISEDLTNIPVVVSYLGYETKEISPVDFGQNMIIILNEQSITLEELVIRPISPTEYIKRAIRSMSENYPDSPFKTLSYYREKFMENGDFVSLIEGYFKSYYPQYQDTIENQHQLLLFREIENPVDINFMNAWVEKKERKEAKKASRKGEEYEELNPSEAIREGFGGPENILSMDLLNREEPCLDSTLFKKFIYQFAEGVQYLDRELLVIDFESRGTVEHTTQKGKIYLDISTDAIVALEYSGEVRIPALVKPILFAIGLSIDTPQYVKKIRYQLVNGRWYPENFEWNAVVTLKKNHLFRANEKSNFTAEQVLKVNSVLFEGLGEIDEEKRFDAEKDMASQQYNDDDISWSTVYTLLPEIPR